MYISVNDAATKFNISKRRVQLLCEQGLNIELLREEKKKQK